MGEQLPKLRIDATRFPLVVATAICAEDALLDWVVLSLNAEKLAVEGKLFGGVTAFWEAN